MMFGVRTSLTSPAAKRIAAAGMRFQQDRPQEELPESGFDQQLSEFRRREATRKIEARLRGAPRGDDGVIKMVEIIDAVALLRGVTAIQIKSHVRSSHCLAARYEVVWLAHRHTTLSTTQIGRFLGNRDHATIINANRRYKARIAVARAERRRLAQEGNGG